MAFRFLQRLSDFPQGLSSFQEIQENLFLVATAFRFLQRLSDFPQRLSNFPQRLSNFPQRLSSFKEIQENLSTAAGIQKITI